MIVTDYLALTQLMNNDWDFRELDYKKIGQTAAISFIFHVLFGADPVDCVRGRFFLFQQDIVYQDLYGQLRFSRQYDSRLEFSGTMGKGWRPWQNPEKVFPDENQEDKISN